MKITFIIFFISLISLSCTKTEEDVKKATELCQKKADAQIAELNNDLSKMKTKLDIADESIKKYQDEQEKLNASKLTINAVVLNNATLYQQTSPSSNDKQPNSLFTKGEILLVVKSFDNAGDRFFLVQDTKDRNLVGWIRADDVFVYTYFDMNQYQNSSYSCDFWSVYKGTDLNTSKALQRLKNDYALQHAVMESSMGHF